jgi:hypothetical protein
MAPFLLAGCCQFWVHIELGTRIGFQAYRIGSSAQAHQHQSIIAAKPLWLLHYLLTKIIQQTVRPRKTPGDCRRYAASVRNG